MEKLFDTIAKSITSLGAVVFVMLMTISGMIIFSHTLFSHVFPDTMAGWEKVSATWLMALGWEFTVLITTCNTKHINRHIPLIMAICSGVIVLFFIQAFSGGFGVIGTLQRWFVGLLAATINYIYAELFYAKWQERNEALAIPIQVNELLARIDALTLELDERKTELATSRPQWLKAQSDLDETSIKLNQSQSKLNQVELQLHEAHSRLSQAESELNQTRLEVNEKRVRLDEVQSKALLMERQLTEVNQRNVEAGRLLDHNRHEQAETGRELAELRAFKAQIQKELECPHCKAVQPNARTLNAHKGHCPENPINKPKA